MSSKAKRKRKASAAKPAAALFLIFSDGRRIEVPELKNIALPENDKKTSPSLSGQASIKLSGADRAWRAAVAALGQGRRAAMDGASLLQTAESGIGKTDRLLEQMRQLAQAQDILYEVESYVDNTAAA